jgi:polynucleotide 5'-kinase involved in rRNA processing
VFVGDWRLMLARSQSCLQSLAFPVRYESGAQAVYAMCGLAFSGKSSLATILTRELKAQLITGLFAPSRSLSISHRR